MMAGIGVIATGLGAVVASAGVVAMAATQGGDAVGGVDTWTLLEKGGLPLGLFIALGEVYRQLLRAQKTIESKDATILALSTRQVSAIETGNEIAGNQIQIARTTESLLRELVTLVRGRLDIG